jgi:hypothetical protein
VVVVVVVAAVGAGTADVVVVIGAPVVVVVVDGWAVVVVVEALVVVVVVDGFGRLVVVVAAPAPAVPITASKGPHATTAATARTTRFAFVTLRNIDTLSASALPPSRRLYRPIARNREPQRMNLVPSGAGRAGTDAT